MSPPMVRCLLKGAKTQTRRTLKPQPRGGATNGGHCLYWKNGKPGGSVAWAPGCEHHGKPHPDWPCPYGVLGDRLWVRETWGFDQTIRRDFSPVLGERDLSGTNLRERLCFRATSADDASPRWRPSIHMPRWASRITLEITEVRVQRLQDISEEDKDAEGRGADGTDGFGPGCFYRTIDRMWDALHGDGAWKANPWVWAITFQRVT